jgi:hypothetical protein
VSPVLQARSKRQRGRQGLGRKEGRKEGGKEERESRREREGERERGRKKIVLWQVNRSVKVGPLKGLWNHNLCSLLFQNVISSLLPSTMCPSSEPVIYCLNFGLQS